MYYRIVITIFMKKVLQIFLISLFVTSCGGIEKDRESVTDKTVFRYNESAGISTLDPAFVRGFEDFIAVSQVFNGLVSLNSKLEVVPSIADRWEISENGKEYTFYLRNDVYFHDNEYFQGGKGRLVTADDVVYSFLRIIDPSTASSGKYVFQNIDRSELSKFRGMVAVDDFTIKIFLKEPQPSFIFQLSLPFCSVVPSEVIENYGLDFGQHPIGTGPFMFKSWKPEIKLVMVKNKNYFERDEDGVRLPYLDAVSVSFMKTKNQEYLRFKMGKLDMISGLSEDDKDELITNTGELRSEMQDDFHLQKLPWLNTEYLGILMDVRMESVKNSPLKDKLVRQAIGYGIDRKEIIKYQKNSIGKPASKGFVPVGMPGFDRYKIEGFNFDFERAQQLLIEAGYPNGEGAPEITLVATVEFQSLCQYLQKALGNLGLKVNVDIHTTSSMTQRIALFDVNFYRKSWVADYPDAINYFQLFYSNNFYPENGSNYTHFNNIEYDLLYEAALFENNDRTRYELYKEMQLIIQEEVPVIPLFYAETFRCVNNKVVGLEGNSLNMLSLKRVKVEKK